MPLSQIFFWGVPIVALASYFLLFLFIMLSQKDRLIKAFIPMLLTLIVWTTGTLLMRLQMSPSPLFWNRFMVVGMFCVPLMLYIFISVFTNSFNKIKTFLFAVPTLALVTLNLLGYVVTQAYVVTRTIQFNGAPYNISEFVYSLGWGSAPAYLFMLVFVVYIFVHARNSVKNGFITYKKIRPILIGIIIIFLGTLFNILPQVGKYPVDILACLINAVLIIFAIYKQRMLELKFMLTKGIVYTGFGAALTVAYIFVAIYFERSFFESRGQYVPYMTTIFALLFALAFQPLYSLAKRIVDRMFYKASYSQRLALKSFSLSIANELNLDEITTELLEAVQKGIGAKKACLALWDEEYEAYKTVKTTDELSEFRITIEPDNPIVSWFNSNSECLSREEFLSLPYFKSMWDSEKRKITQINVEIIVPIKSRKRLIGMLFLSSKYNNTIYTLEDKDLLTSLGVSTAVVIDNARLYISAQKEAITDSLTKLFNHRFFCKELTNQIERVKGAPLSLLMIDLDMFKLYNDLYGHVEGDRALQQVASTIMRIVGAQGCSARYGGEEFAVLLPYLDSNRAYEIAEKIRLGIQDLFIGDDDVSKRFLTASIGVCTYPFAAPNAEELMKRADFALYSAKNNGKNKTVIYTPSILNKDDESGGLVESPAYATTIFALTATIDAKDHFTFGHSQNVAEYTTLLAEELGMDKSYIAILREAALLHDIGKIGIPEHILTKKGKLTDKEMKIMKKHVEMSIEIIKHLPTLKYVVPAIIAHHERWDGKGYPRGLKGEDIPIAARCLAIADSFDAMTSERPYKKALDIDFAISEIESKMGTQFDPYIARVFIDLVKSGGIKVHSSKSTIEHVG